MVVSSLTVALAACSSPAPATPTPDPRIDDIERAIERIGPAVDRIDGVVGRLEALPTPSPLPSATASPTVADIRELIAAGVAEALGSLPTPTPVPTPTPAAPPTPVATATPVATPTPGPTLQQIEKLVDAQIASAIAGLPTPAPVFTPEPSPTPAVLRVPTLVAPQVSGPASVSLGDGVTLTVEPGLPLTGRDVRFTIEGITPWQRVEVQFIDPAGQPVQWISDYGARLSNADGRPVLERALFAGEAGTVRWLRIGTLDREGVWSVRVTTGGSSATVTYPVVELQLAGQETQTVGVELRLHRGIASNTYYSALVPSSLAVDLQSHLAWVVERIQRDLGLQARQIPDIYLVGNKRALEDVSRAVGVTLGLEDGYYKFRGPRSGIYLRTDFLRSEIMRILTHEYVHLAVLEAAGGADLPAWLNEGLATYIEFELGLDAERPSASRRWLYASADLARAAASSGALLPLTSLESHRLWAARTDPRLATLQYSEAHMAARFMAETFGPTAGLDVAARIAAGARLPDALLDATGVGYDEFRERFLAWLLDWSDPEREEVRTCLDTLATVMETQDSLFRRREAMLTDRPSRPQRLVASQALVFDAQVLLDAIVAVTPAPAAGQLHDSAISYLGRLVEWLTLEWEFVSTGSSDTRAEANAMISEIDARRTLVVRAISDLRFGYHLDR